MNRRVSLAVVSALMSIAPLAHSETTVFGLTIGRPLSVPECPKYSLYKGHLEYKSAEVPCARDFKAQAAPMNIGDAWVVEFPQRPAHAMNNRVQTIMVGGLLEAVLIWTNGYSAQETVFDDLVRKFGEPTKKTFIAKSNSYGASIQSIEAVWDGGDELQVFFFGVQDRINQGQLMVGSKRGVAEYIARMNRATGGGARTPL